jgi:5'-methylthioadenosine phosphorylase
MAALKQLGVTHVIGLSAVGSLKADLPPGAVVVLDDFIGPREMPSLRGYPTELSGCLHAQFTNPFCPALRNILINTLGPSGNCHPSGTYVQTAGPRFETPAEVRLYRDWRGDVVGMTCVSEAVAARYAGLHYAGIACVTNLGSGIEGAEPAHEEIVSAMACIIERTRWPLFDAALEASRLPLHGGCQPRS